MRPAALFISAVIALLAASPAQAAKPDRAGARGLAAAVKHFRSGIVAERDALQALAARRELPACLDAIRHVPLPPDPAFDAAGRYLGAYTFQAFAWPIRGAAATFAAELRAVRVKDPVLRRGRAALRKEVVSLTRFQEPPADLCEQLDAWRRAGYPANLAPVIDDPAVDAALIVTRRDPAISRAARRLRELGASRRVKRLWSGEGLLAGINLGAEELPVGEANEPRGPATASAASRRGDRKDARAFAAATRRIQRAIESHLPEAQPAADRWLGEPCKSAFEGVPPGDLVGPALGLAFGYFYEALLYPARADLLRFSQELDAVRVSDPVLKSGRAAWRRQVRAAQQLKPAPEDICTRLDAWRQAGYPADQVPDLDDPGLDLLDVSGDRDSRAITRAGKRLRKLGIKKAVTKDWGGLGFLISG